MGFMKWLRNIFFIFCAILWGNGVDAQAFEQNGVGKWHTLPFADVRLLSCTTGTLDRNLLVGGLQIKIHSGWILKKPRLKPLSENAVLDYPIRPDPLDTTQYTGTILLPIVQRVAAGEQTHFGAEGHLIGCWDDNCLDLPVRIELPLDSAESDYTSYCAYIMDEMGQTPKLDLNMGTGQYISEHQALLRFRVPNVYQAFLQNQNGLNFKILQTQFWQDMVQLRVSYSESWPKNTLKDWILITNQGIFRVPIRLTDQPLDPISQSRPWGMFLWVGGLLFICSPFFIFWGTVFPKTVKQLRRQCVHAAAVSAFFMTMMCFMIKYFNWNCDKSFVLALMGITLIFPPRFIWWCVLLSIIWPKPYLLKMIDNFSLYYLLPWLILWQIVPFWILYRHAEFWRRKACASLKKSFFSHNLFFLLPTIVMLFYQGYVAHLSIPYQQNLNFKHTTLVCTKDDCESWLKAGLQLHLIDAQSPLGKTLLRFYQASENVLIFNDDGIQTILVNTTPQKLKKYLIGLQNYRAGYRPIDPPVHFGDGPHVP